MPAPKPFTVTSANPIFSIIAPAADRATAPCVWTQEHAPSPKAMVGPMESHNFERLKAHILLLSVSQVFDIARTEWILEAIEISEEFDTCLCGQEIKEHCYIRNRLNGNATYVGNVCINRFIQIDTGNLFDGLKRIAADITVNANHDLIEHAWRSGYLFGEKEYIFLKQTSLKRKLSPAQTAWKVKINRRILAQTKVRNRTQR